jgi:hypothetical protein
MSSLPILAHLAVTPDDLTTGPNGDLWVSATNEGQILDLNIAGTINQTFPDPNAPEGMIITNQLRLVGEQVPNRIDSLAANGTTTPFLVLPNRTGLPGVDSISLDSVRHRLLVPNSPEGTLLTVPLDAPKPTELAANLGRPVSATVGPDGAIYVAAESPTGLLRVPPGGGPATPVGTLSQLDEVISVGGLLYTIGAADGSVRAVDPTTGMDRALATGGQQLQGLTALPDGRILIADSDPRTISVVTPCR